MPKLLSHLSCCCIGLIKVGLLQQLFVGAVRSGTAPSSTCAAGLWHWHRTENTSGLSWKNFHWLPVKDHIDHKILPVAYNCFSDTAPQYLQLYKELINCYKLLVYNLFHRLQSHLQFVKKHTKKAVQLQGFLQLWPKTLECPPSGT